MLTEAEELELLELEAQEGGSTTSQSTNTPVESKPTAPRSLKDRAANLLSAFRSGQTDNLKQLGSDALDVLETPGRGVRGLVVGAQDIGNKPLSTIPAHMAEAVSPDFQPTTGAEKLASAAGTMTNLAVPVGAAMQGIKASKPVQILFGPGRLKAGKALGKVEEAAGLAQEVLEKPTAEGVRNIVKKILPAKNTEKIEAAYLEMGKQNPQGLKDLHDVIRSALDASSPKTLAQTMQPKILTKAGRARLAANEEAARKALNTIVPGREEAAQKVANAITREEMLKPIVKAGKRAIVGATLGAGGTAAYKLFQ